MATLAKKVVKKAVKKRPVKKVVKKVVKKAVKPVKPKAIKVEPVREFGGWTVYQNGSLISFGCGEVRVTQDALKVLHQALVTLHDADLAYVLDQARSRGFNIGTLIDNRHLIYRMAHQKS